MRLPSTTTRFRPAVIALIGLVAVAAGPAKAAEFPFEKELLLDVRAMSGSKRVPSLEVDSGGSATLDLWCNSLKAQVTVAAGTVSFALGDKTDRQCTPDRVTADEAILTTLTQVTAWHQNGDVLVLEGGSHPLRFRSSTN
jgi:heat shock protein HslJ